MPFVIAGVAGVVGWALGLSTSKAGEYIGYGLMAGAAVVIYKQISK